MPARVLIITPIASHPRDQGNGARIHRLGRLLQSAGLIVHMLWYPLEGWNEAQQREMAACWDHLHVAPPVGHSLVATGAGAHALDDWSPPEVTALATALHRRWRFDAVLTHYVWFSAALEALDGTVLKLLDTHDVFADRHRRLREMGMAPAWFSTTPAEEARGLARADIVLAIQDEEAAQFRAYGHPDVRVLGHLPRGRARTARDSAGAPVVAGYLASSNPLNLTTFEGLQQALPKAPRDMQLLLAGPLCEQVRLPAPFLPLGRLDHTDTFYDRIDLALNPMAGGTGLKIKSVEALFEGVPLLATRAAMTGLPALHAMHGLADTAEFAACLRETRFGLTLRRDMAAASRAAAAEYGAGVRAVGRALVAAIGRAGPRA